MPQDRSLDKTPGRAASGGVSLLPGFKPADFQFLSLKEISEIFGRDVNEIARLVSEGLPTAGRVKGARRFDLVEATAWFCRYLQNQLDRTANSPSLKLARQNLLQVQFEREQLALEKERGRLIDVGVLEGELSKMTTTLREQLLLLPARIGPDLGLAELAIAQLRCEVEKILTQLSGQAEVEQSLVALMHAGDSNGPRAAEEKMPMVGAQQ